MSYTLAVDLDAVRAIDMHVHVEKDAHDHRALPAELTDAAARYFKAPTERMTVDQTAHFYREQQLAGDHGVRGWKFHPTLQGFDPSDEAHFPLYAALEELGLPAIFHTGQTGIGAGLPGGHGLRLGLSNPMLLDVVVAEFPGLTIVLAHPSVPWQDEAISVATHKGNVYIDLSGWSPKYFPPQLVRQANSVLQDKVLFGSDFPLLTPERWFRDFAELDLKESVRPKILKGNAAVVLGLAGGGDA